MTAVVPRSSASPQDRLRALDGLRGLAILWAVSTHLMEDFRPRSALDRGLFISAKAGWIALEVFFALSGFLITRILWDTRPTKRYLATFYARRLLRIVPVYYGFLLLLIFWVTQVDEIQAGEARTLLHYQGYYWGFLVNWLVAAQDRWTVAAFNTAPFWSLSVEEQFYLLWPLCVMRLRRERLQQICVAAFFVSVALRGGLFLAHQSPLRAYVSTPARLDSLALGSFVALVGRGPDGLRRLRRYFAPVGLGSLAALAAIGVSRGELIPSDMLVQIVGFAAIAMGSAALLGACAASPGHALVRALERPGLLLLGRYSYVMYVVHFPLVFALKRAGFTIVRVTDLVGSLHLATLIYLTVTLASSIAIAHASFHLVEKPLNARKDAWFPVEVA